MGRVSSYKKNGDGVNLKFYQKIVRLFFNIKFGLVFAQPILQVAKRLLLHVQIFGLQTKGNNLFESISMVQPDSVVLESKKVKDEWIKNEILSQLKNLNSVEKKTKKL